MAHLHTILVFRSKRSSLTKRVIRPDLISSLAWPALIEFVFWGVKNAPSNEKTHPSWSHTSPCMVHTNMIFLCARLTKRVIRPDLIPSFAWPTLIFFVRPKKCPIRRKESSVLISSHPFHGPPYEWKNDLLVNVSPTRLDNSSVPSMGFYHS